MIKLLALALVMFGILLFGLSFHNIDLSVNMAYGAVDVNGWGYQQDKVEMYLNGLSGIIIAEVMQLGGILLLLAGEKK